MIGQRLIRTVTGPAEGHRLYFSFEPLKFGAAAIFVLASTIATGPQPFSVPLGPVPWKHVIVPDLAFGLLVLVWLAAAVIEGRKAFRRPVWRKAIVPLLVVVVSTLLCTAPRTGIPDIARLMYSLVAYVLIAQLVFSESRLRWSLRTYLAACIALASVSLAAYFAFVVAGWQTPLVFVQVAPGWQATIAHRTMGPFSHPTTLALFLNTAMFAACALWVVSESRRDRLLAAAGIALFMAALLLTSARALGGVLLGVFLVSLLSLHDRPWKAVRTVLLGELVVGFTALAVASVIWDILPYSTEHNRQTQFATLTVYTAPEPRLLIWAAGLHMVKDHPLFGIGPGLFEESFQNYVSLDDFTTSVKYYVPDPVDIEGWYVGTDPHSTWVGWLARTGIIGFAALCWFFGSHAVALFRARDPLTQRGKLAILGFAFLLGIFYSALTVEIMHVRFVWSYLAFLTALLVGDTFNGQIRKSSRVPAVPSALNPP